MAEVGLLPFARVALQVATQVLPPYRSRFSKHRFTQPQLLAVLCLMRYEDWTFREAEVRLREHHELRAALRLRAVPDYTTLYRFLRRLEDDTVDRGLQETVRRLRRRRSRPISAAIDGTGLSDTSVSTFFHRRLEQHAHGPRPRRPWLKWLIVVDVRQQILLAQRARQGPGCDARALPGLLDVAARGAPIGVVLADAEFDSEANHQHIRQRLGAKSIIPARRRGVPNGAIRNQMFRAFPKKPYRQRNKIESIFSAVKRKLSSRAPGRSLATQIRQALLLGLAYNIYRLRHRFSHRGCQQSPSIANKRLTAYLSPLDATLTRNGGYPPFSQMPFSLLLATLNYPPPCLRSPRSTISGPDARTPLLPGFSNGTDTAPSWTPARAPRSKLFGKIFTPMALVWAILMPFFSRTFTWTTQELPARWCAKIPASPCMSTRMARRT